MSTAHITESVKPSLDQVSKVEKGMNAPVVSQPTSPDQIHDEAALSIAENLTAAGHRASNDAVKVNSVFKPTSELQKIGVEPSNGDLSTKNLLRIIGEEFNDATAADHRVVEGKGVWGAGMNIGRQIKKKALLGFKKAA